ncbi:hypothetical protein CC80DRAFT_123902 [Byssothecium circinans]|uniref:Rhodopsin domain-containing protein n=1 Tax=Byssothecium circinans TaxID=147558 RepID=A0A6A5TRS8_9PLEO|nr:hypothetical protein CC80DRAFT_123902 [Byssothecium circinans]
MDNSKCLPISPSLNCPALRPPPGLRALDPRPHTLRPAMIATITTCLALTIPALGIRIFTRSFILRRLQVEDYSIMIASLGYITITALTILSYTYGRGTHQWNITIANARMQVKYIYWIHFLYPIPMFFAKLALLLQIKRISTPTRRTFIYYSTSLLIIANAIVYLAALIVFALICRPREKFWNPAVPGNCLDTGKTLLASSVVNLVSDVAVLVVPVIGVWGLGLGWRRKVGVGVVFGMGVP